MEMRWCRLRKSAPCIILHTSVAMNGRVPPKLHVHLCGTVNETHIEATADDILGRQAMRVFSCNEAAMSLSWDPNMVWRCLPSPT